jgi:hypothetical protein
MSYMPDYDNHLAIVMQMMPNYQYRRSIAAPEEVLNQAAAGKPSSGVRGPLRRALATKASLQEDSAPKDRAHPSVVYTIEEFCVAHRISRAYFYVLLRSGNGPKTYTAGRRRYISLQAAAAWVRHNEILAAAQSASGADQ